MAPRLVADSSGIVHAFSVGTGESSDTIEYRTWTLVGGWTDPVDVIFAPQGIPVTGILGVELDEKGWFHLAVFLGNETAAGIYYTRAPAAEAGGATAWTSPVLVGSDAGIVVSGRLLAYDDKLFVLYSGRETGNGLYAVESSDGGDTWSGLEQVYGTGEDEEWVSSVNVHRDGDRLHAVWGVVGTSGNSEAIFYSNRTVSSSEWSEPLVLGEVAEGGYETDWPTVFAEGNDIMTVYNDGSPAMRWMRQSLDGGSTWSEPLRLFEFVGEYGFPVIVSDSNRVPHMVFGNRTPDGVHGMWHSVFRDGQWTTPEPIVSGPRRAGTGLESFDPTWPSAVIVQGNVLLVTWMTDWGLEPNGVWYSSGELDAPNLPARPLPTAFPEQSHRSVNAVSEVASVTTDAATNSATVAATVAPGTMSGTIGAVSNPWLAMAAGLLGALVVVAGTIAARRRP